MTWPERIPSGVPFSLTCEQCDAGMEIGSYEEAIEQGWTDIVYAPEQLMANFLGLCPECRQRLEMEERGGR